MQREEFYDYLQTKKVPAYYNEDTINIDLPLKRYISFRVSKEKIEVFLGGNNPLEFDSVQTYEEAYGIYLALCSDKIDL